MNGRTARQRPPCRPSVRDPSRRDTRTASPACRAGGRPRVAAGAAEPGRQVHVPGALRAGVDAGQHRAACGAGGDGEKPGRSEAAATSAASFPSGRLYSGVREFFVRLTGFASGYNAGDETPASSFSSRSGSPALAAVAAARLAHQSRTSTRASARSRSRAACTPSSSFLRATPTRASAIPSSISCMASLQGRRLPGDGGSPPRLRAGPAILVMPQGARD